MLTQATIKIFKWGRFEQTGESFGFAEAEGVEKEIFIGTRFRVSPMIRNGEVVLEKGLLDTPLWERDVEKGAKIMVSVTENEKGLAGFWCPLNEWLAALSRLEYVLEKERIRVAERRQRVQEDPKSVAEAKEGGWTVHSEDGRQVIMHRKGADGKTRTKTFYKPKSRSRKPQLQRT